MTDVEEQPYRELPPAMIKYFAARLTRVGKHAGGHRGQKAKAHQQRRGTHGKAVRRRVRQAQSRALDGRVATAMARKLGAVQSTSNEDVA